MAGRKATPIDALPDPNPSGLCGCGCGAQTSLVKWSDKTKGLVRGHHRRFINGHDKRIAHACQADECDRPHEGHGYCTKHLQRWKKRGDVSDEAIPPRTPRPSRLGTCSVEGCGKKEKARAFCRLHYLRWWRDGDPGQAKAMTRAEIGPLIGAAKKGWRPSEETRRRMGESAKVKVFTPEHRKAIGDGHRGKKRPPMTPETYAKVVIACAKGRAVMRDRKGPTRLELAVRGLLDGFGVEFIEQHPIGVYTVDFYIPKIGLVIEADGAYWHKSEARERARDAYLMRPGNGVTDVVHLSEEKLKPWTMNKREWNVHQEAYRTAILAA